MFGIRELRDEVAKLREELKSPDEEAALSEEVLTLRKRIATLEIQESKIQEKHEREDRELRHMIGLEKKRQEFEVESAKRDTELKVREENLAADRKRFEEQMQFQGDRFAKEVDYLKGLMGEILGRLPTVTVERQIHEGSRK
jgi:chromosome segregation ATPase